MDCITTTHVLEIFHNLSIIALLLTTYYFGSKQINKSDVHPDFIASGSPQKPSE
jgi:hypothetical protein